MAHYYEEFTNVVSKFANVVSKFSSVHAWANRYKRDRQVVPGGVGGEEAG